MTLEDQDGKQVQPFAAFLQTLHNGEVSEELSAGWHSLVAAVNEIGKKGSLTLKLELKPDKTQMLTVVDTVSVQLPEPDRVPSMYYTDRKGNLSKNDPNQMGFPGVKLVDTKGKTHGGEEDEAASS